MRKSTITQLFFWSLLALVAGLVLMFVTAFAGYFNGAFVMRGADGAGIQATPEGVAAAILGSVALTLVIGGGIGQLIAWIGAMVATARAGFTGWFLVLLLLGVAGLEFVAMVVYVVAGPDEYAYPRSWRPASA